MAEYATFTEEMVRRGVIRGGERLRPTWAATTAQGRDGDVMISDGLLRGKATDRKPLCAR
jgi:hypothetical protein